MTSASQRCFSMILFLAVVAATVPSGFTQTRLSDKDIEHMMSNLKDDAKKFRSTFNSALSKSTIRKTSAEKDAKALAQRFQDQTGSMLSQFQSTKKADTTLPVVLQSARDIEKVKSDAVLGPTVDSQWAKIRTELDAIAQAFSTPAN